MERNGVDPINKKNSKLESFLKRNLETDAFERICYHESCIVLSNKPPKLDKALSYVVVGHDTIYLTENPPKTIRAEAHYKNVIGIELKNDYPNFLGGEERENTLHIAVTHLVEDSGKQRKSKKNGSLEIERTSSLPASLDLLDTQESAISTTPRLLTPRPGGTSPSLSRKSSSTSPRSLRRSPVPSPRLPKKSTTQDDRKDSDSTSGSWDEEKFLNSFDDDLDLEAIQSPRLGNSSSSLQKPDQLHVVVPKNGTCCVPRGRRHDVPLIRTTSDNSDCSSSGGSGDFKTNFRKSSEEISYRPLPSPTTPRRSLTPNPVSAPADLGMLGEIKKGKKKENAKKSNKTKTKMGEEYIVEISDDSKGDTTPSSVPVPEEAEYQGMKKCTSNIYMLCYNSPVLAFMRNACDNYSIRGTMLQDPIFEANSCAKKTPGNCVSNFGLVHSTYITVIIPSISLKNSMEKLASLYGQLKQEILSSGNNIEEVFSLINELKVATERNYVIKKLFWKNSDLYHFLVRLLQKFLPKSPTVSLQSDDAKSQRADELELVNLVLETLSLMFRETDTVSTRLACLKHQKGKVTEDLVTLLMCSPEIPQRQHPMMTKAAALLLMTNLDQRKCLADVELNKLLSEYTTQASILLFELIEAALKINWDVKESETSCFSLNMVINILQESKSTETFVKRVIAIAMRLISPSTKSELTPKEVILLYMQFSVLSTLMTYSHSLCMLMRLNYFEEFKYYIQAPVIMSKLPKHYPITKPTLAVMEKVITKVLQKDFSFKMLQRKRTSVKSIK